MQNIIYGPVPSWRLGKSLGIDLISSKGKVCSFDCIYCQLGRTVKKTKKRQIFVKTERVEKELKDIIDNIDNISVDAITFSGTGEPTISSNLGDAVKIVRKCMRYNHIHIPIAILTNSSLIYLNDVRNDLLLFDIVVAKLDAPNDYLFNKINKPVEGINLNKILNGMKKFRKRFDGKFALQIMFVNENKGYLDEFIEIIKELKPDEIQINTPLRKCPVKPLSKDEIKKITLKLRNSLYGVKIVSVYEEKRPFIKSFIDIKDVLMRRPERSIRYLEFYNTPIGGEILRNEVDYLRKILVNCKRILDVGCGPGVFEKAMPDLNIIGIDLSYEMVHLANKITNANKFIVGNAEELPFKDNSFDCLMYITSLEFINNYKSAIDEAVRVLSRDGKIIVLMLNPESEYFKERIDKEGYIKENIKHNAYKIKEYLSKRFNVKEEYMLGIRGDEIFNTNDKRYASIYSLIAIPK